MKKNIKISGVGCCLVDRVYNNISFSSDGFEKYLSHKPGDGGLVPGNLVFREEFEDFSGLELNHFVRSVSGDKEPDAINIGGPAIVALIHAAQLNQNAGCSYHFYGVGGEDSDGDFLNELFEQIPVNTDAYDLKGANAFFYKDTDNLEWSNWFEMRYQSSTFKNNIYTNTDYNMIEKLIEKYNYVFVYNIDNK